MPDLVSVYRSRTPAPPEIIGPTLKADGSVDEIPERVNPILFTGAMTNWHCALVSVHAGPGYLSFMGIVQCNAVQASDFEIELQLNFEAQSVACFLICCI